MSVFVGAVLAFTILVEVCGQLCFKQGLRSTDSHARHSIWLKIATAPLIWAGIALYAAELGAWLFVLSKLPLSAAFPVASLSYCGIALASWLFLKEPISPQRWAGTLLIAIGAAIVGISI